MQIGTRIIPLTVSNCLHMKTVRIDNGSRPVRSKVVRYCPTCGARVCSYKDGGAKKAWCYLHDQDTPFTITWFNGWYEREEAPTVGPGRGDHKGVGAARRWHHGIMGDEEGR